MQLVALFIYMSSPAVQSAVSAELYLPVFTNTIRPTGLATLRSCQILLRQAFISHRWVFAYYPKYNHKTSQFTPI